MNRPDETERKNRVIKIGLGTGALICLLAGLALYLFAEQLGINPETAELIAIAFLVAGCADYILMRFWDRIAKQRR